MYVVLYRRTEVVLERGIYIVLQNIAQVALRVCLVSIDRRPRPLRRRIRNVRRNLRGGGLLTKFFTRRTHLRRYGIRPNLSFVVLTKAEERLQEAPALREETLWHLFAILSRVPLLVHWWTHE